MRYSKDIYHRDHLLSIRDPAQKPQISRGTEAKEFRLTACPSRHDDPSSELVGRGGRSQLQESARRTRPRALCDYGWRDFAPERARANNRIVEQTEVVTWRRFFFTILFFRQNGIEMTPKSTFERYTEALDRGDLTGLAAAL